MVCGLETTFEGVTLDAQVEERFGFVGSVSGVPQHRGARRRVVDEPSPAREGELVAAGLRLGKALQREPSVSP